MSNLGPYLEITKLAKEMGGVDEMIKSIESDAVKKAVVPLLIAGIAAGELARRSWAKYKKSGVAATKAKNQLKAVVEEAEMENGLDEISSEEPRDTSEES